MKKWVLIGWLIGILGTASAQQPPVLLDPSKAIGTSFSSIFEEAEIIPLETSRKSVFGVVKQLLVTPEYFIILDGDTGAVLFFDQQGHFINKYKPAVKHYQVSFIQWDRANNAVLIFSQNKNYNISAAKLGSVLSEDVQKNIPKWVRATRVYLDDLATPRIDELPSPAYLFTNPVLLGKDNVVFSFIKSNATNKDTLDHQLKIVDSRGGQQLFFPYHTQTDSLFYGRNAYQCSLIPTLSDSVIWVTRPFDSIIYTLTPSAIVQSYKVVTPRAGKPGMSPDFESMSFFDGGTFVISSSSFGYRGGNRLPVFNSGNNTSHVIKLGDLLFFNLKQPMAGYSYFIHDQQSGRIYDYKELKPDSSNYFFPMQNAILASDEKYIYHSVSARNLFTRKKSLAKTKLQYQASLAWFFATGKETDNPVLIRLKPKEKLRAE